MRIVFAAALACLTFASWAHAAAVTVPDDFATIQLAIDSGADTVRVRAASYAERPTTRHSLVVLEGLPADGVRPRLKGLFLDPCALLIVRGLAFTGSVDLLIGCSSVDEVRIESCDLDSGYVHHPQGPYDLARTRIFDSMIRGPVTQAQYCERDTFEAAGVQFDNRETSTAISCRFQGPGSFAMRFSLDGDGAGFATSNTIDGYVTGISAGGAERAMTAVGNQISNCERGISIDADDDCIVASNLVRDCHVGVRMNVQNDVLVTNNQVLGCAADGILVRLESGGNVARVFGNRLGRNGGDGLKLEFSGDPFQSSRAVVQSNTSYRNTGSGYVIRVETGTYDLDLTKNIGFQNGGWGVDADTSATPNGCNDWYDNGAGAARGVTLAGTDLAVHPEFCDVQHDSVKLAATSPLVNPPGCGLIGASGVGCATADVRPVPVSGARLVWVTPNPAIDAARIHWSSPRDVRVDVTVHDLAGREIAVVTRGSYPAGERSVLWDGRHDGVPVASGVYFARVRIGEFSVTRSFLVRR